MIRQYRGMPIVDLVVIKPKELQKLRVVLRDRFKKISFKPKPRLDVEMLNAIARFEETTMRRRSAGEKEAASWYEKQFLAKHKLHLELAKLEKVKGLMVAKCSCTSRKKCPKCGGSRVKVWATIYNGKRLLCPTCGWTSGRTDCNG